MRQVQRDAFDVDRHTLHLNCNVAAFYGVLAQRKPILRL